MSKSELQHLALWGELLGFAATVAWVVIGWRALLAFERIAGAVVRGAGVPKDR